jgi:hypothetical protein
MDRNNLQIAARPIPSTAPETSVAKIAGMPEASQPVVYASNTSESWHEHFYAQAVAHPDLVAGAFVLLGFCWRVWLAQATFFNTDEAWHYFIANQASLLAAYKASLTLAHPPLMVFVLYFWRQVGTSDLMLRLPGVVAGTVFCWIFYKWLAILFGTVTAWCGLIFSALLPPMIALSAEVRQYSWMLMFCAAAAYFLERALDCSPTTSPVGMMSLSSMCLWLAMLSHYSAFLFAASLGVYAFARMLAQRPSAVTICSWAAGQGVGVGLAAFLYRTHISKLGAVYPGQPLNRFADFYLKDWYFHPGHDHLFRFLWKGTFGIFRFTFGQTAIGQLAALVFFVGVFLLIRRSAKNPPHARLIAILLATPFVLNWIAVTTGLYPYGRTRQCVFLAIFGLAGVSFALSRLVGIHSGRAVAVAVVAALGCQIFGTLQGRDMLPLAQQRHEHMDRALQFIRSNISASDVIFTDKATAFQLGHYLCEKKPVNIEPLPSGFEVFRCDQLRVVATGPNDGSLNSDNFMPQLEQMRQIFPPGSYTGIWVVQGGWSSNLGETLRQQIPEFSSVQVEAFDRYLEVFKLPQLQSPASLTTPR